MPFLDVLVIKNDTLISTDIFFKITDSKQYLNFKSCHPKHTKTNIPFSLARRMCTIISDKTVLKTRLKELFNILLKRKYPFEVIKTGILNAIKIPRNSLLTLQNNKDEHVLPFVSTHNPRNKEVFGVLKNNLFMMNNDETMKRIMNNNKIIKCKRQLPNLKQILIKSEFRYNESPRVSKCNEPRCGLCSCLIEGSTLQLKDKTFYVKESMNCTVKNVLYVLTCNGCGEFYIGQTGDKLRNRRTVHDQQIRDPSTRQLPLSTHLDKCSNITPKFSIFPFYKFYIDNVSARLSKEHYFMSIFEPKLNIT